MPLPLKTSLLRARPAFFSRSSYPRAIKPEPRNNALSAQLSAFSARRTIARGMSLARVISNANNSDDAPTCRTAVASGRACTRGALHFTISRHSSPRTYKHVRFRATGSDHEDEPSGAAGAYAPRTRWIYLRSPPAISARCLWPDTILRRSSIFLPVTFIPRILINSGIWVIGARRCAALGDARPSRWKEMQTGSI